MAVTNVHSALGISSEVLITLESQQGLALSPTCLLRIWTNRQENFKIKYDKVSRCMLFADNIVLLIRPKKD